MPYFVAVQKTDGLLDVIKRSDYDSIIEKGEKVDLYESLYIPTYFFSFSNGLTDAQMTDFASKIFCRIHNCKITSSTKMTKSTFGAEYHGYHPGLGCVTRGKEHVNAIMKERGLVECGDKIPETKKINHNPITEDIMRDFVRAGASVSDREADALVSGTYSESSETSNE